MTKRAISAALLTLSVGFGGVGWWMFWPRGNAHDVAPVKPAASGALQPHAMKHAKRAANSRASAETAQGSTSIAPEARPFDCSKPDGLAATVNGRQVTLGQLCGKLKRETGGISGTLAPQVLDRLEESELVWDALASRSIGVSDAEIEAALSRVQSSDPLEQVLTRQGLDGVSLRAELGEKVARRKLVDELGELEPTGAEIRLELQRAQHEASFTVDVEAWIARIPPQASAERVLAAESAAAALVERLRHGEKPGATMLKPLPAFKLSRGQGEPELERTLLGNPDRRDWQGPIRTRAGWVAARATGVTPVPVDRTELERQARQLAVGRRRQAEQRRIFSELRARATIVLYVMFTPRENLADGGTSGTE